MMMMLDTSHHNRLVLITGVGSVMQKSQAKLVMDGHDDDDDDDAGY